jgi:multiple sugar transport system ATP-binding protein
MASVVLRDVHKSYGKVQAVRGISMDIEDGEFIAFLGPSGCGKSSTMRMIAGLEEITAGDILFNGDSVIDKQPKDRNVAMAFETYALYPTLNVYENLAFPLRAAGWERAQIDKRVREVADIIGVSDLFDRKPGKLSSGQSQAVGLARALIRKPNVFLLDEPISHLDTSQRFHMRVYIKRLHIDLGHTMILVTHDQEDAMALADRVAVMSDGKLHQIDTPGNIYSNPVDLFVAGFIGNLPMNFIIGNIVSDGGNAYFRYQLVNIPLPPHYLSKYQNGSLPTDVVLGIRPFYMRLHSENDPQGEISSIIFVMEPLGDMNVATIQVEDLRLQVVTAPTYKRPSGAAVKVSLDPNHILLFDKVTGLAI